MSVGILTSGGDAPGMNAAVRAVFRSIKMEQPRRAIAVFRGGFRGLAVDDSMSAHILERAQTRGIIHRGGTFLGTGRLPELAIPDDASEAELDRRASYLDAAIATLARMKIDHLVIIGGDGSFRGARRIAEHHRARHPGQPFRIVGIPGTIDNDIHGTDYSIGFDTALNNVVDAIRKIRDTVESHKRAILLEVMGNSSGWLALQSAIAGGASVVAIPEIESTSDHDRIVRRLVQGARRDYRYFIIVFAEGVRMRDDGWARRLKERIETDAALARELGAPMEARINAVGHVARGGSPSALDNTLAGLLGSAAADIVLSGQVGDGPALDGDVMVGCRGPRAHALPLTAVIDASPRLVSEESPLYRLSLRLTLRAEQPF
ncbi:MAG: ATP-dependent 6-phosphofructokinase [Nannocystaceae bacterium]|nr:ATP-dependent 6-phosphofructokinase [Myxococcales bacterium]